MSISVETLALAKKYAEEVAGSGGGGANPDTIAEIVKTQFPGGVGWEEKGTTTITWGGDTTDLPSIANTYFKVSDMTPSQDDFANAYAELGVLEGEHTVTFTTFAFQSLTDGKAYLVNGTGEETGQVCIVATEATTYEGMSIPEPGIYFFGMTYGGNFMYTKLLTLGSTTIHAIDPKFMPDNHINSLIDAKLDAIPIWTGGSY